MNSTHRAPSRFRATRGWKPRRKLKGQKWTKVLDPLQEDLWGITKAPVREYSNNKTSSPQKAQTIVLTSHIKRCHFLQMGQALQTLRTAAGGGWLCRRREQLLGRAVTRERTEKKE